MLLPFAFLLIALLAFANGSNDVSKCVATLVGSGVTNYRRALRWGTAWTIVGALLGGVFAGALALRFAESLGRAAGHDAAISLSVVVGAIAWVAFSSRTGLPVSTTHAIAGAILGVGWIAQGLSPLARMDMLEGFFVPLLVSPLMALALTFFLGPAVERAGRWLDARCACAVPAPHYALVAQTSDAAAVPGMTLVMDQKANCEGRSAWSLNVSLNQLHWLSSGLVALSRGMNDAPKIWALAFPVLILTGANRGFFLPGAIVTVALAMGLGSWVSGRKVTEVLAHRVTRMNHEEGFAANLSTALLVVVASRLGLPVSTTHVSSGAIVGVGLGQGRRGINWAVLNEMLLAWVVTLPVAATVAMACYWILR